MAKIADAEETEAQEAAIRKRRGERSQTGGDVVLLMKEKLRKITMAL